MNAKLNSFESKLLLYLIFVPQVCNHRKLKVTFCTHRVMNEWRHEWIHTKYMNNVQNELHVNVAMGTKNMNVATATDILLNKWRWYKNKKIK